MKNDKDKAHSNRDNKGNSKLCCLYTNARSVVNKRDELELYLTEEKPDIVAITETWLNNDIEDSELNAAGYAVVRKDREKGDKTKGGGVLILVKTEHVVTTRSDIRGDKFEESVWCNVGSGANKILIGCCYRAPNSGQESDKDLIELLKVVSQENVVVMGDFNFPDIKWNCEEQLDDSHFFLKCLNDNFMHQKVTKATRGDNILDLILVTNENIVEDIKIGEPLACSDHNILRFDIKINGEKRCRAKRVIYDYFKADYSHIRHQVRERNRARQEIESDDVETAWEEFKSVLTSIRDKDIKQRVAKNGNCCWMTRKVIQMRRAKVKAWRKYRDSNGNAQMYNDYKAKLTTANKAVREAKKDFERKLAQDIKKNSKSFFKYVNGKRNVGNPVGPIRDEGGDLETEDGRCANILNNYFGKVFTREDCISIPEPVKYFKENIEEELKVFDITVDEVEKKLADLNVNKSPGSDGLHPKLLFELRKEIAMPLTSIYNKSIKQGIVPGDWKYAEVTPIFKKGNKNEVSNYRPVSLTSISCKVLESLIKDRIVIHCEKFKLIRDSQHGFVKGKSCLTNLIDFFEEVTKELDNGKSVDVIYLDFAKAFDKVPHKRLLKKIEAHGIGGKLLGWIENWLTGRTQAVRLNGTLSEIVDVISGVPQGSVLGPLLFTIFINDIDEGILSKLNKFADDSKLCRGIQNNEDRDLLSLDLEKLYKWSVDWQMMFNVDKCVVVHLGNNNEQEKYHA